MRADMGDGGSRCSVCYATYGYMGDLLRASEALRWSRCAASLSQLGP
jgi:ceramide kinase